jgi:DNA-directed RNA polymerase subunit delta
MATMSPIELAFTFLRSAKKDSSFEDIWNAISQDINGDSLDKDDVIAELYTELVLDNRFALTANGTWGLRDYLKLEDVKKQYDYVDKFETTEEFDEMGGETTVFSDSEDTNENLNRISNKLSNDGLYDDDDDEEDEEDEEDDDDDFDDGLLEDSFDD